MEFAAGLTDALIIGVVLARAQSPLQECRGFIGRAPLHKIPAKTKFGREFIAMNRRFLDTIIVKHPERQTGALDGFRDLCLRGYWETEIENLGQS